ncbi:hypothetical protein [Leifsonia sp. Leaf264]|uniref:hypothetical protein n=1 Tax=Leifsonia sp. Leaf264 TaxID=1736314 RepID=UPI0006FF21FF|nr:hypothetical protein [Leifsonia sp. Leaf264]KQO98263.1 hypothetical protein ASF30_09385 [Leifsonia sp. Leaf264]
MSSDNFYLVRKLSPGQFTPVMGFASDDIRPPASERYGVYPTPDTALAAVIDDWAEYGHSIDPECYLDGEAWDILSAHRLRARTVIREELSWQLGNPEPDLGWMVDRLSELTEDIWDGDHTDALQQRIKELEAANVDLTSRLERRAADELRW